MSDTDSVSNMSCYSDESDNNSFSKLPKRFECKECSRKFSTRYNLQRHIENLHSDTEEAEDEDMSEASEDVSDDEHSSEDDGQNEMYLTNMFRILIGKALDENEDELSPVVEDLEQQGFSNKSAIKRAVSSSVETKKTLRRLIIENFINIYEHRRHPLFKAIMEKAKEFMDDGFNLREAVESAVAYRKHAIYQLVNYI